MGNILLIVAKIWVTVYLVLLIALWIRWGNPKSLGSALICLGFLALFTTVAPLGLFNSYIEPLPMTKAIRRILHKYGLAFNQKFPKAKFLLHRYSIVHDDSGFYHVDRWGKPLYPQKYLTVGSFVSGFSWAMIGPRNETEEWGVWTIIDRKGNPVTSRKFGFHTDLTPYGGLCSAVMYDEGNEQNVAVHISGGGWVQLTKPIQYLKT